MPRNLDGFADEIDNGLTDDHPVFLTSSKATAAKLALLGYRATTDPHDLEGAPTVYVLNDKELIYAVCGDAKVYFIEANIDGLSDDEAAAIINENCSRAKPWSILEEFGFYSVSDLTEEERRPPEFIVEGMIPVGITFLSGAPKLKKSFLALQIAIAVATGNPILGHVVLQSEVAYFDLEGSKCRISFRTDHMRTAIPDGVHIRNEKFEDGWRLADGLVDKLRALVRKNPAIRLIIIDTYSRARGSFKAGGANAYDADVALLEPVQRMALEENIAILFVHHDKKGAALVGDSFERLSGTMGISGSADCVINLVADGKRADGRATLEYNPRDARGGELSLVFDETCLEWMSEEKPTLRNDPVCEWIIENKGNRGQDGRFYSYEDVFYAVFQFRDEKASDRIKEHIIPHRSELFLEYNVAVQTGVKSNGKRGIRIINME